MKKEEHSDCCSEKVIVKKHHCSCTGGSGAIYGLGIIGALFYFLQGASTFGLVLLGIGKAIFWPAILMYELLTFLQI